LVLTSRFFLFLGAEDIFLLMAASSSFSKPFGRVFILDLSVVVVVVEVAVEVVSEVGKVVASSSSSPSALADTDDLELPTETVIEVSVDT